MKFVHSITFKVWLCAGVGILGFLVATLSTWNSNNQLTADLGSLRDTSFPLSMKSEEARNLFALQTSLYEDAFLLADEDALAEGNAMAEPLQRLLEEMQTITRSSDDRLQQVRRRLTQLKIDYSDYSAAARTNYGQLVEGADIAQLQGKIRALGTMQQELAAALTGLKAELQQAVEADIASGESAANINSRMTVILFLVFGLLSIIFVNLSASRLLVRPIRLVQRHAGRLAEGDFAAIDELDAKDGGEIGDLVAAMRTMGGNLRGMIGDITSSTSELGAVSGRLKSTSGSVAESAREQVDEVANTSKAVARIGASVSEVGEQMEQVSATSEEITSSVFEQAASTEEIAQNIDKLSESAEHVNAAIIQVGTSIRQISGNVGKLRDESDATASSAAEMESSIRQVMQGAKDTAEIASTVHNDAEAGHQAVTEAIAGMQRIKESSRVVADAIRSFSDKTENIGTILSVIDNLADETNLLALNAAIIAAQAGEHGRGFAVVADQIKELADQTSLSTREIVSIIDGVRDESRNAVSAIADAERSVVEGESLSVQSGAMLQKIVDGARQAVDEMAKISRATNEQVHGSGMIRSSMENVSDMVRQIVVAIDEQEKGSASIMQAAERVRELVAQINTSIHEQSRASRAVATGMQDVNTMIKKVFVACDEQRTESRQITGAVETIDGAAQKNLNATEVVNAATGSLEEQLALLQQAVNRFNLASRES